MPTLTKEIGIIIPAHQEEEALPQMLEELMPQARAHQCHVVVGVNGSTDQTARLARAMHIPVAETAHAGYGYGCEAAIQLAAQKFPGLAGYLFMAADGANDPGELPLLLDPFRNENKEFILGSRTRLMANRGVMGDAHWWSNRFLGFWSGCLSSHRFSDLGPFRLIDSRLYHRMQLQEMQYGFTIESQVLAPYFSPHLKETPVHERPRLAGKQKISGVHLGKTLRVGAEIMAAACRTRWRLRHQNPSPTHDPALPLP